MFIFVCASFCAQAINKKVKSRLTCVCDHIHIYYINMFLKNKCLHHCLWACTYKSFWLMWPYIVFFNFSLNLTKWCGHTCSCTRYMLSTLCVYVAIHVLVWPYFVFVETILFLKKTQFYLNSITSVSIGFFSAQTVSCFCVNAFSFKFEFQKMDFQNHFIQNSIATVNI